jgi:transcriptional regulator with XRE-family HTH domain
MDNEGGITSNIFGKNLANIRQKKGLSLRKLALLADMEHHQILHIESGADVKLSTIHKLAKALEVPLKDLFEE